MVHSTFNAYTKNENHPGPLIAPTSNLRGGIAPSPSGPLARARISVCLSTIETKIEVSQFF